VTSAQQVWEISRAVLADQDGWVVVLRAYMDESGTHDDSPVVVVGMYIGKPRVWVERTKDWNRNKKPIKVYHAVDYHNRTGEFEGWERPKRDAFVANLLPVRHSILGIVVGIHMGAFHAAMEPHPELRKMFGTPYTACFQWAVQTLISRRKRRQPAHCLFFHECNDYENEARAAFSYVGAEKLLTNRIMTLAFGGKDDFVPLQAADILAYEGNHLLRDPGKPDRLPWKAMNPGADVDPEQRRIRVLHYGQNNMQGLISRLVSFRQRLLASGWDGKIE
jgi:Protein of unknown function (DUF3800)